MSKINDEALEWIGSEINEMKDFMDKCEGQALNEGTVGEIIRLAEAIVEATKDLEPEEEKVK